MLYKVWISARSLQLQLGREAAPLIATGATLAAAAPLGPRPRVRADEQRRDAAIGGLAAGGQKPGVHRPLRPHLTNPHPRRPRAETRALVPRTITPPTGGRPRPPSALPQPPWTQRVR